MPDFARERQYMVEHHIAARGVRSPLVLNAMGTVPREEFLPSHLRDCAYEDTPLPIGERQTISQPYIVAFMVEALGLDGGETVLEIGAGSGYAAAILSRIAAEVYTVERIGELAQTAASKLEDLGYDNVHVLHADGTRGWPDHAPYDAIIVAAGGPEVPQSLKQQLKIGGRLVIPVGSDPRAQELIRVTRLSEDDYKTEDIADVRFVPLLGEEGWVSEHEKRVARAKRATRTQGVDPDLVDAMGASVEPFRSIDAVELEPLLGRIGDARIVLIGEATHGTSEFYEMREQISRALITEKDFSFVAIEGDWPDAARIDHYVRHSEFPASEWTAFARFPQWMWRNDEVRAFVDWLREHNADHEPGRRVAFHGLDLYSLYNSIRQVLDYLDDVDPEAAKAARERYGCLTPWQADPATYGRAALTGRYRSCENDVAATEMSIRGELNLGELCRRACGDRAYLIGLGTNSGTVAAASDWDGPMEVKTVRPAIAKSYEGQCHAVSEETGDSHFMLPLGANMIAGLRQQLETPRLERAIGVIYRPETELASHYFQAVLPRQFDEYIWLDETKAVTPVATADHEWLPDTYPFGV